MKAMEALKWAMMRDPIITVSCLLGGIGVLLPAVVVPIRNAFSSAEPVQQPKLSDVVSGMTGK
ncbi:hypothetical protein O6H91_12G048100 [Diphasiastrum complanatum]|uniref:Uncharacterized protein n=2 Tax=Diphasiastrum complanatum TaxID=34168 RepID=A0ACC2C204_DIPCM|nr:hypothetical protein O6H91_12G031800 [Diphasiastrum complanatum]KAJ7535839.1 hypothetical protein O6H91_12G048100 [Diphasiastrum complanatum]